MDFSGVSEFIDQPLRTYSSGMSMGLASAVAINVDPDVLIIDEVLGVGDHGFASKCVERGLPRSLDGKDGVDKGACFLDADIGESAFEQEIAVFGKSPLPPVGRN